MSCAARSAGRWAAAAAASAFALLALAPAPAAHARLTAYPEGPGAEPTVRPGPGAGNHWYWEEVNETDKPVTVCFRWRHGEDAELTPYDGSPYEPPADGELPAHGCDPVPIAPAARAPYDWSLSGLEHHGRYRWCAAEWSIDSPGRGELLDEQCSTITIDSEPPLIGVVLSDAAGRQGATNNPDRPAAHDHLRRRHLARLGRHAPVPDQRAPMPQQRRRPVRL